MVVHQKSDRLQNIEELRMHYAVEDITGSAVFWILSIKS